MLLVMMVVLSIGYEIRVLFIMLTSPTIGVSVQVLHIQKVVVLASSDPISLLTNPLSLTVLSLIMVGHGLLPVMM